MSVVKLDNRRDKDVYKIDGEGFQRLREIVKANDALLDTLTAKMKEIEAQAIRAKDELWDAVHKEIGKKRKGDNFRFDREYEELGFYIVKKIDDKGLGGLLDILKGM